MELYEAIFYRKTVEKYSIKKVKQPMIEDIKRICKNITYLNEDLNIKANVVDRGHIIHFLMGKECKVKAPHYIVVTSDKGTDYLQNIGFAIESVVLQLTSLGIGTCYIESNLDKDDMKDIIDSEEEKSDREDSQIDFFEEVEEIDESPYVIIAFGYPAKGEELFKRRDAKPDRKSLKDITKGFKGGSEWDCILEMARRSPSINNCQPWFFYKEGEMVHLCEKKQKQHLEEMSKISVGAALRHFDIACKYHEVNVIYEKADHKDRRGKEYFISIKRSGVNLESGEEGIEAGSKDKGH